MYLCGVSFRPLVTGRLSDHFAHVAANGGVALEAARAIGLHQAMYLIPACFGGAGGPVMGSREIVEAGVIRAVLSPDWRKCKNASLCPFSPLFLLKWGNLPHGLSRKSSGLRDRLLGL